MSKALSFLTAVLAVAALALSAPALADTNTAQAGVTGSLTAQAAGDDPAIDILAQQWYQQIAAGSADTSKFSDGLAASLTPAALKALATQLSGYGTPTSMAFTGRAPQRQGVVYSYRVATPKGQVNYAIGIGYDGSLFSFSVQANPAS